MLIKRNFTAMEVFTHSVGTVLVILAAVVSSQSPQPGKSSAVSP